MPNKFEEVLNSPTVAKIRIHFTDIREVLEFILVAASPLLLFIVLQITSPKLVIPDDGISLAILMTILTMFVASKRMNNFEGKSKSRKIIGFIAEAGILAGVLFFRDIYNDPFLTVMVSILVLIMVALYVMEFLYLVSKAVIHVSKTIKAATTKKAPVDNEDDE